MKKKAIKIAASTAVAASAFVAAAPAQQADAATNVNQLITDAQNAGTVLKWAISVEGTADYKNEPWTEYNNAKNALKKAEDAIAKLDSSAKLSAQAKLVDPKVQISRAGAYIDAITSGKKIIAKNAAFEAAVKAGNLDQIEKEYHVVTEEFRKQTILNYRVYGQSTRDEILKVYKLPIEKTVREYASEVTVHMLTKAAATDVKASKFEEAAKKLTEAQAILDAEVLTWEAVLQKSVNDVEASIPLQVLSLVSDNKNTVTVKFSTKIQPGAAVLPAGQFTFSNGLIVQAASVAADGKTVTLTTTDQVSNTEYALSYQGKATGKAFKTPAKATDTTIGVVETDAVNLDNGGERSYTVNVTKADGTPYTGAVKLELLDAALAVYADESKVRVKSVNGSTTTGYVAADDEYIVSAVNGKVTFIVQDVVNNDDTISVIPRVTRIEDGSYKLAPKTTFWKAAADGQVTADVSSVTVDTTNGFIYMNGLKYLYDANDKFFFKNVEVSSADFLKALSAQDKVVFNYSATKANVSTFTIDTDVTADAALKVTNPSDVLTADTNATRLEGTGQPGHIIEVYKGTVATGNAVATTTVSSNGSWVVNSLNLTEGAKNDFVVTSRPVGSNTATSTVSGVTVYQQFFATEAGGLFATDVDGNGNIGIGDIVTFNVKNSTLANNELKVSASAKITLQDDQGYTRYYTVSKVTGSKNQVVITGVETKTPVDAYKTLFGNTLVKVEGISNQDNLVFNVAKSVDVKLDTTTTP
ncbi:hypothetical protein [Psychrobacillus sp. BL-248-WT-3]|uniref:hypothetical protein n=1 Tax=Psychrobacillus sp. BL-248-WT-3 TaxID=2725306 RepID=UPI00146D7013|nr:hypothetical protein [Psychrobacillus sp. BL-248-WT-3]NME05776.1 hypothetical protein [Psychrobacillus sp. BL-248-WT-3]